MAFLVLITFSACQKEVAQPELNPPLVPIDNDPPISNTTYPNVDPVFWPYFQRFEIAAAQRGVAADLNSMGISVSFADLDGDFTAGVCHFNALRPLEIEIDPEIWNRASENIKEMIIFHELGHCYLGRDHRNEVDPIGNCRSLMNSGTISCKLNYIGETKEYYLDELFNWDFFNTLFGGN